MDMPSAYARRQVWPMPGMLELNRQACDVQDSLVEVAMVTKCRCCGGAFPLMRIDNYPIHTRCIPKHWGKHSQGINASRCKEFGKERVNVHSH